MIVRTYTRRPRCGVRSTSDASDGAASTSSSSSLILEDTPFSQDSMASVDPYSFLDSDPLEPELPPPPNPRRHGKPPKGGKSKKVGFEGVRRAEGVAAASTSLMEAQEFGEMMEHVDEVNFALDGLRPGQPVRILRSSLLSLLTICSTSQQRRLLRARGMGKKIIDAVLGLNLDDSPSVTAASALLFVWASDVHDDHLLDSPSCIQFLIKLLNPPISRIAHGKPLIIGSKLLGIHKHDNEILNGTAKRLDSASTAIVLKVRDILQNCKEMKEHSEDGGGTERPELSSKWIVLLTMEKACLSTVSFEETPGSVKKASENFKERLREYGGLDAIFSIAIGCLSKVEGWLESGVSSAVELKQGIALEGALLLLKCLKIMENATFLSKDNQNHLLGLSAKLDSGLKLSCVGLVIAAIRIFSGLYLLQNRPSGHVPGNQLKDKDQHMHAMRMSNPCEKRQKLSIPECVPPFPDSKPNYVTGELTPSTKKSKDSVTHISCKKRSGVSLGGFLRNISQSRVNSKIDSNAIKMTMLADRNRLGNLNTSKEHPTCPRKRSHPSLIVEDSQAEDSFDPFQFDEDELGPSKWEALSTSKKPGQTRRRKKTDEKLENELDQMLKITNGDLAITNGDLASEENNNSHLDMNPLAVDESPALLEDSLLTATKVLMNLTNDNPEGCQQIAACGGLETMASLIVSHFPSFGLTSFQSGKAEILVSFSKEVDGSLTPRDKLLDDHQLEFLVAILGLLVNLVEKDSQNRSRLVSARIKVARTGKSEEKESLRDIIPLLCSIFLINQESAETTEERTLPCDNEIALLQGEREAEMMIIEAYAALLLAFLSMESKSARETIAGCLPHQNLKSLVPVLERFVEFHLSLNMISEETYSIVNEVIESCRMP